MQDYDPFAVALRKYTQAIWCGAAMIAVGVVAAGVMAVGSNVGGALFVVLAFCGGGTYMVVYARKLRLRVQDHLDERDGRSSRR